MISAKKIIIKGLVQGVGFRTAIYRIALKHGIVGTVENNNKGVFIIAQADKKILDNFIEDIPISTPEASSISSMEIHEIEPLDFVNFEIVKSSSSSNEITEVSPDIAICSECLDDMERQDHRINYAFTNCTNCGPRFTIIRDLPYDRPKTTMDVFPMCKKCSEEYVNILDRRFHAQPVACNNCGPRYSLEADDKSTSNITDVVATSAELIDAGKILAIKGLGGYHIACNATNNDSIDRLRNIKLRDGKPLALMFRDSASAQEYLDISATELELLESWRKPILLLNNRKVISKAIGIGLDRTGVMLPYMPFHHLLFQQLKTDAIVLTSGNISDEPIIISNDKAIKILKPKTDAIVTYNRDIHNRTDDSVVKVISDIPRLLRRSRGYAPSPIELNLNTEGIFAAGAELVNCFCIGKGNQAILSQHIGDLKNLETLEFYEESVKRYFKLFRFNPTLVVRDNHPDYLSSNFAEKLGINLISVQHHHAHIASCMAEHKLDEKVIGISFDGTGLGNDNNIWGGEFFICDLSDYKRINHFEYIPQPGGDAATKHPWRMMAAYLIYYFGKEVIEKEPQLFSGLKREQLDTIVSMIELEINCPLTSSAGRLFDAVSALLGICQEATYHAEAPMQLEALSSSNTNSVYNYQISDHISFKYTFAGIIDDMKSGVGIAEIAGKFHNTVVDVIEKIAVKTREETGINKVVLSGGTFQNSILMERSEKLLEKYGFKCFTQSAIPSNDGGLALGQLAIAAKRRELNLIK